MRPLHIFFAVMVAILWGANFVAAKYGIAYFPPFFLTGLRFIIVSLLMVPFVPRPTLRQWGAILPISLMSTLHFSLLFVALNYGLDIASAAIIGQLGVPFACLLGVIFMGDRIGVWRLSGIVIAFVGIAIVAGTPNILHNLTAFYLALTCTFVWGAANIFVKRIHDIGSMQLLAWTSVGIVPMVLALSFIFEYQAWPHFTDAPWTALVGLSYTAVFSTIVAYGLWYFLLSRYTVSQVTPFSLLTPIFSIGFGQMFFAETLTAQTLIGGALTIVGVAIIVLRKPQTLQLGEAT